MSQFKNMKFRIKNKEHSEKIQKRLKELGYIGKNPKVSDGLSIHTFWDGTYVIMKHSKTFYESPSPITKYKDIKKKRFKQGKLIALKEIYDYPFEAMIKLVASAESPTENKLDDHFKQSIIKGFQRIESKDCKAELLKELIDEVVK